VVAQMVEHGQRPGVIVNMSSISGKVGMIGRAGAGP